MKISQILISLKNINNDKILEIKNHFNHFNHEAEIYFEAEIYDCSFDKGTETWNIEFSKNNDLFEIKLDFNAYLSNYISDLIESLEENLINIHLNMDKTKFQDFAKKVLKELKEILVEINLEDLQSLQIYQSLINDFINKISKKYIEEYNPTSTKFSFESKIKWLGNINTLTTFLIDYSSSDNNLNKSLIERDYSAFKNLILNCFVDKDGKSIEISTIYKYFDPKNIDYKRAKKELIVLNDMPEEVDEIKVVEIPK